MALTRIQEEIQSCSPLDDCKNRLYAREIDILAERRAIREQARDDVFALSDVISARETLVKLGDKIATEAAKMTNTNKVLLASAAVLSIGQSFVDVISEPQNSSR